MLDLEIATVEQVTITCHEDDMQHVTRWSREHDFCITNVSAEAFIKSGAHVYVVTVQRPFDARVALSNPLDVSARDLFSGPSAASGEMDALPASENPRMFERSVAIIEADTRRVKLTRDDRKALLAAANHCPFSVMGLLSESAWEQLEDRPDDKTHSP